MQLQASLFILGNTSPTHEASWTICRASPLGPSERKVRVSSTGRPSVTKEDNGVCN